MATAPDKPGEVEIIPTPAPTADNEGQNANVEVEAQPTAPDTRPLAFSRYTIVEIKGPCQEVCQHGYLAGFSLYSKYV